tara:strand:+ start:295 stop:1434 length:1140 start_codon:yes stop_codon:yes gene_type:complete
MAGTRSAQERNFVKQCQTRIGVMNPKPVWIQFNNTLGAALGPGLTTDSDMGMPDIVEVRFNEGRDMSGNRIREKTHAPDVVCKDVRGKEYYISMKEYNPGNLCGQGLRTFSEEHALLNKWMTVAAEKVAERLEQIQSQRLSTLVRKVNQAKSAGNNGQVQSLINAYQRDTLPQVYVPIPLQMRKEIFASGSLNTQRVSHFIVGRGNGAALCNNPTTPRSSNAVMYTGSRAGKGEEQQVGNHLRFNDCDFKTVDELARGGMIYLIIRKRRATDQFKIIDKRGQEIKGQQGFLKMFTPGGMRVQVRSKEQLPKQIKDYFFSDNQTQTKRVSSPRTSLVVQVPLSAAIGTRRALGVQRAGTIPMKGSPAARGLDWIDTSKIS